MANFRNRAILSRRSFLMYSSTLGSKAHARSFPADAEGNGPECDAAPDRRASGNCAGGTERRRFNDREWSAETR
jgi:hypothetical protein